MSRRLEALQWFGLFGGALAWTAQFVVGFGIAQAECSQGGSRFGIDPKTWEAAAFAAAAFVVVLAEVAAIAVVRATRNSEYDGPPPTGRRRFFALASTAANVLFLAIVLETGLGSLHHFPCGQS
jgi:hypothetical protein